MEQLTATKLKIDLDLLRHLDQDCIAIRFPYNVELVRIVKLIPDVNFSNDPDFESKL
jgi:hypothetical protein